MPNGPDIIPDHASADAALPPKLTALAELGVLTLAPSPSACAARLLEEAGSELAPLPCAHTPSGHHALLGHYDERYRTPFPGSTRPLFGTYTPETPLAELTRQTRLFLLLGAGESEAYRTLTAAGSEAVVIVLEPDPARLAAFLAPYPVKELAQGRTFFLCGEPEDLKPQLAELFTAQVFAAGYPVFLERRGQHGEADPEALAARFADVIEYIECLHYRQTVYPISGHDLVRSHPLRDVRRGVYYDQQKHVYENLADFVERPDIGQFKDALQGQTAMVVAAGPALDQKIELIRANRERVALICVNNGLRTLLTHGIVPDVVVIVDSSVIVERSFAELPEPERLAETLLVAHCFASTGGGVFNRLAFYGNCLPDAFPGTHFLPWHGSVLTTAVSLAAHLGCAECALAGAQLGSDHEVHLGYTRSSVHHTAEVARQLSPPPAHARLYPARDGLGRPLYTNPNFLDVAHWIRLFIAASPMRVVNTSAASLVHGANIRLDEDYLADQPEGAARELLTALPTRRKASRTMARAQAAKAMDFAEAELTRCRQAARLAREASRASAPDEGFLRLFQQFEQDNTSYLVQRFADFDNAAFHAAVFAGEDGTAQFEALRMYFSYVAEMYTEFSETIEPRLARLRTLAQAAAL